ncbi:MAG: metalloprotease PmbA [Betaproteobacteria bacterium]|nr:metalloprotease PmbA [Betaproteobacteria bacterium]MDE2622297.1 metalloprotease PmbA [Betaproteobacteria bacterium]
MDAPVPANNRFSYSQEFLRALVKDALDHARRCGASAAEADASEGFGHSVTVRLDEVETIEYNRDKDIGITVFFGQQRGHASTSDFSPAALRDTVEKAISIARHTASDPFAGLADPALLAGPHLPDLDLYHPWALPVESAIDLALRCEAEALAADSRISNSEGATVYTQESQFAYGNSLGFLGGYAGSSHGISCSVIAGTDADMQRDYWYSTARDPGDLESAESVGRQAGVRTARRLKARKLKTCQAPVLFDATLASSLIGHFVGAVSGGALYRKSSFLPDSLGKPVFSSRVRLREEPHRVKGLASAPFDDDGVATRARDVVTDGVVQGYFLGSYSARKLGMTSTGNAGGNHNLVLDPFGGTFEDLLRQMGRGLLVTELLGHGVNGVTGDYSRGAAGFWVEGGVIQYPVQEITIAGNLKDMFRNLVAVGNDTVIRGSKITGSILVEGMTIAGD